MLLVDAEAQPPLLTLACRFMPYDQWLTTHVNLAWKVKDVKVWILSKCLGIPLDAVHHPASQSVVSDALASNQQGAAAPGKRYRPASPITFAPDPRRRPISPILFAKGGKGKEKEKGKGKAVDTGERDETASQPSPVDGYEEDDEWDATDDGMSSFDDSEIYRHSPPPPLPAALLPLPAPTPLPPPIPSSSKSSNYNLSPGSYTLIRFSTGQALEDDLSLTWYDLSPDELVELHAHEDVCVMPAPSASSTATQTTMSDHGHGGHTRNTSIYSLSPTVPSPPPAPPHKEKDSQAPKKVYLPNLDRSSLTKYIEPYWESPVRELRSVPMRTFATPMPNFLNGYGYGYSGVEVNERAMALGIGHPPPFGMHQGIRGVGGWDAKVGHDVKAQNKIEWRPRQVVIKEGRLTLSVGREDANPRHIIPLSAFTSVDGADYLINYIRNHDPTHPTFPSPHRQPPPYPSPPRAPKFKSDGKGTAPPARTAQARHSTSTFGPVFSNLSDSDSDNSAAPSQAHRQSVDTVIHNEDGGPRLVGGEPIDKLHIVCLRYKSVDKLKRVATIDADGLVNFEYNREEKERERRREFDVKTSPSGGRSKKKKEKKTKAKEGEEGKLKKGKGRGKGFPWDRDDKEEGARKEKKKADWIAAFSVKKDRDHKDKDKDSLSGMAMGVSLGLGLSGGLQESKEWIARNSERERERERTALTEADAEASIVFARRSEAGTSSEEEVDEPMEEEGTVDEGHDDMPTRTTGGNRGDLTDPPADDLEEADIGADADGEADADSESDVDSPILQAENPSLQLESSHSHGHSRSKLKVAAAAGEDGEASEAWSSPVFAHTDSTDIESDGESEIGGPAGKAADLYRYGYRYGATTGRVEPESVHEGEDRREKEKANLERRKQKEREKRQEEEQNRENEKTEWIILDLRNELAYKSFLRVLHRHISTSTLSFFTSAVPVFSQPTPTSTPTPTRTPFPSPTSPNAPGLMSQSFHWMPSSDEEGATTPSQPRLSAKEASGDKEPFSPISPSSKSDRFNPDAPQHPPALAALSQSGAGAPKTFGILPYPEWRTEITERAQRAGMGNVGRAMDWILWGSKTELESALERTHSSESTSTRRRSTTSTVTPGATTSTPTGGLSVSTSIYDSDVSEETRKMLDMSDSEEESEAEWQGWMADLQRQRKVQEQRKREEEAKKIALAAANSESDGEMEHMPIPRNGAEVRTRRVLLEPKAVISVKPPDGAVFNSPQSTPAATLYSKSSSDSLSRRAMSFSPVDRSSSPAGTSSNSHVGHTPSQSTSPLGHHAIRRHAAFPTGSSLYHSTSMYTHTIRSDANAAEQSLRRPSMPILTSDQTFTLYQGSKVIPHGSALRSPITPGFSFPTPPPTHSPPFSPSFSSTFTVEEDVSSSTHSPSRSPYVDMPRRASSAGLTNPALGSTGGSLGRSTSVLTRGGLLKKDGSKEAERLREKERRTKEKEDKAKERERIKDLEREAKEARRLQRPKLSLATSSTHHLVPQPATSLVRNDTRTETGRSLMRRVKSGSNLNDVLAADRGRAPSPARDGNTAPQAARKKRFVDRFVRGLDSALDFVEGR